MGFTNKIFTLSYPKGRNRIDLYDFLRGIAMLIVMIQHSNFPGSEYLLTFHMPLFFFLSGIVVGGRQLPSFGIYVANKFKRLMVPYFCFGLLSVIINYIFLACKGEQYNVWCAMQGLLTGQYGFVPPQYSGLYWFLFVMFVADLINYPINKFFGDNKAVLIGGATLFLILSYVTTHFYSIPIFTIEKSFVGAAFILLGSLCKPLTKYLENTNPSLVELLIIVVACFGVWLSECMNYEPVLMYLNQYGNYGWFLLGSLSGILAVILLSKNIYYILVTNKKWLYNLIMWLGFNSLVIFPVHLMINKYFQDLYTLVGRSSIPLRLVMMLLLGIPICNFITNYLPWMLGQKNKQQKNNL